MNRLDILAHLLVALSLIAAVTTLGLAHVLSRDTVAAVLVSNGGAIGLLTWGDHVAYSPPRRRRKRSRSSQDGG